MAKVFLLTTAADGGTRPFAGRDFTRLTASARSDSFGRHAVAVDPESADLILFVGAGRPDFADVRRHPLVRRFREKCFLFDAGDRVIPFLPGVYASSEMGWFSSERTRTGFFLRVFENEAIREEPLVNPRYLFTFVGNARNASVRGRVMSLSHPRAYLRDTSTEAMDQTDDASGANAQRWSRYVEAMRSSSFVLCPRGLGTSTWRLFEAMKMGRAPVILSDAWILPEGPDWEHFSVRVRERDTVRLPLLLEAREGEAASMGRRAREEWSSWFSREVAFHRIVEWCSAIQRNRGAPEALLRLPAHLQLLRPYFFRHFVLGRLKRVLSG